MMVARHFAAPCPEAVVVSALMGAGKSKLIEELCADAYQGQGEAIVVSTSTEMLTDSLFQDIGRRCRGQKHVGCWYGRRKMLGDIIVVCNPSVPALVRKLRASGRKVLLWIADECHRTEAPTILEEYDGLAPAHALGVTATPFRADEAARLSLFKRCLYRYGVNAALEDRVVVPWRLVHVAKGAELDAACLDLVAQAEGPGLVNARDIADAENFARLLTERGIAARAIHSGLNLEKRHALLKDLETGGIKAAVHVNMLSEGANYPFLRWLVLRREVESRVRFIQEIGRLLRSCPGKSEATFYDPHDLFGTFRLAYAEALGEPPPKAEVVPEEFDPKTAAEKIGDRDPAVALAWIESIIRTLVVAADAAGMLADRPEIKKAERFKPANNLQRAALQAELKGSWRLVPTGWKDCLQAIIARPEGIRFGFVADLLAVLAGVNRSGEWPPVGVGGLISAVPNEPARPYPIIGDWGQMKINLAVLL